jgi:hypothetical protein
MGHNGESTDHTSRWYDRWLKCDHVVNNLNFKKSKLFPKRNNNYFTNYQFSGGE